MIDAAVSIGSAILPTLIAGIREGLDAGLSEEEATQRALERMRSASLPAPLAAETREAFAAARAALEPKALPVVHAADLGALELLARSAALSHEERGALTRVSALVRATLQAR